MKRLVIALAACGSGEKSEPPKPTPIVVADAAPAQPKRFVLGECSEEQWFESGPRPQDVTALLGDGSGDRTGFGPGEPRFTPVLRFGHPVVVGALDKSIIRRYLERNVAKLTACYDSKRAGDTTATFTISKTGAVRDAKVTGFDPKLDACVKAVIAKLAFPRGGIVKVEYPLHFAPQENIERKPGAPYDPSAHNPLRGHVDALRACVTKPYGVGLVEFGEAIVVHGVDGDAATCIAAIAKHVDGDSGRWCSFAYGTMPVADLPAFDIDERTDLDPIKLTFRRQSEKPVTIVGPVLLRAAPSTPMRIIADIEMAAFSNNRLDVLVTTTKQLPFPIELPAVPVPVGTGDSWADGEALHVHVRADRVRVDGVDVARNEVAAELAKTPHASIGISADDAIPIQDVIDVATSAKVPWRIVFASQ